MIKRKGIILAGGHGTRLFPLTIGLSKQLLPVYDKPMIYYPLSVLMLCGIHDILVITAPEDQKQFQRILGDGNQWGINLNFSTQQKPEGIAQAFMIARDFLAGAPSALILGDNLFFGHGLAHILSNANNGDKGATIFPYHVSDPRRYGVVEFGDNNEVVSICEKPTIPKSQYAITGLYFVDETAPERAALIKPSARGELEITSLLESYMKEGSLRANVLGRGHAWLDTGTHEALLDASIFVRTLTRRQGLQVGSPDEVAFRLKWIDKRQLLRNIQSIKNNDYCNYLAELASGQPF